MKKLKNLLPFFLMALVASMTLVSCLNSSDDETLDENKKNSYKVLISGNYPGKLYWLDKNIDKTQHPKQIDSLETTLKIGLDGKMTLYDFPVKLFFKALDVTKNYSEEKLAKMDWQQLATLQRNDEIVKAAEEYGNVDLTIDYDLYAERNSALYYTCAPQAVKLQLSYDGESHDMAVSFVLASPGIYINKANAMQIVEYGIFDGKDASGNYKLLDGKALYNDNMTDTELLNLKFEFDGTQQ